MKGFLFFGLIAVALVITAWLWRVGNRPGVAAQESRLRRFPGRVLRLFARSSAIMLGFLLAVLLFAAFTKVLPTVNQ
jgi:hypothetical protein